MNIMRFFLLVLVLTVFSARGVPIPGTVVLDKVTLGDTTATNKSVGDTVEMKGTPKQVSSIAERNLIPTVRRTEGMECWVIDVATAYRLIGGTANANWVEVTSSASSLVTNIPAPRIRKISQIVSRKNREALSNELVIAQFLFTGGPASNTLAYNPRNVGPSRSLFIRDAMQCVEAHPLFFQPDQLRGWARAFTNNISGIDLFCSEQMQSGVNGYGPYFDSQFDFVWLVYEHYRKVQAPTLFLEMQPRIEAAITRVKSSPFMSNNIPFVSLDTMGGWGFHDTILFETNYNVGMDMQSAMFWIRTCRQLSEMYFASGQFAKGSNALVDLSRTSASVMTNFWSEERGLFRSYQLSITNHSIVGSALAVVYDAVPKAVQQRIIKELISGLPGGEDFEAGNGFFLEGGIRFWPANEHPGITNSQNGGYWPGFAGYVAKAIQYDNPELAEHIVSYHITNTVRLVQAGVTNHIRVGQLEWFGAELSVDPSAFGYNNNIQSQAGGVIAPESTEIFSGFVEGEGSFSKISSMTNGPLEIPSETRFGGGTFPHTLDPGGLVLDNGETTTPSLRFAFGNNLNFGIGSDSFTLWFVYNFLETNGVVLGRWQGDGKLLSLGGFLAAGGVFTGDGSGLTNLSIAGISAALTNNETRAVTLSNTLSVVGETKIGGGNFAHVVAPGLRLDNGETTTPSLKFPFGDNLNFAIDSDSFTLRFIYGLDEVGGTVLGRWQGDGLLLSLGGFLAAGGVFTGDGSGLTNLSVSGLSAALTNNETRAVTFSNTFAVVGQTKIGGGSFAQTVAPGLRFDNNETTTPSARFFYGNNLNYGIDSDSLTLRFTHNLNESGGTVLGRWQSDAKLLSLGGFLAAGGQFTGDGAGLTNLPFNALSLAGRQAVTNAASGGSTPAGADGNVQYNNAGVTGGENALFWDDTNDRLGIGTATPNNLLQVTSGTSDFVAGTLGSGFGAIGFDSSAISIDNYAIAGDGTSVLINRANAGFISFREANAVQVTIASGGNVGIGTTAPDAALEVNHATGNVFQGSYNDANGSAANNFKLEVSSSGDLTITPSGGDSSFVGNVGIGTASPASKLDVIALNDDGPRFVGPIANGSYVSFYNDSVGTTIRSKIGVDSTSGGGQIVGGLPNATFVRSEAALQLTAGGSSARLTIDTAGNVGIGETAPASKLSISGNLSVGSGYDTTAAPANGAIIEGNVGIGQATPAFKLDVEGAAATSLGFVRRGIYTATASFTLTATNDVVKCNVSSGTFTLPTAVGIQGKAYTLENIHASTATIARTSSQTIGTVNANYSLLSGQTITVRSDNANWILENMGSVSLGVAGGIPTLDGKGTNTVFYSTTFNANGTEVYNSEDGFFYSADDHALRVDLEEGELFHGGTLRLNWGGRGLSGAWTTDDNFGVGGITTSTGGFKSQTGTGNAPAGGLGEYVESLIALGSAVSLTTATAANVTSISLTAGDWDVRGNVNFSESGVTVTETVGGITSTTATIPTDGSEVYSGAGIGAIGLSAKDSVTLPAKRISLSGTTTIYLVAKSTFSVGTVASYGSITARRVQ